MSLVSQDVGHSRQSRQAENFMKLLLVRNKKDADKDDIKQSFLQLERGGPVGPSYSWLLPLMVGGIMSLGRLIRDTSNNGLCL